MNNPFMTDLILDEQELTAALQNAGRSPDPDLLKAILENKKQTKPILLKLFQPLFSRNLNQLPVDDPERQLGVVVGRLLIEMRATEAIPMIGEHYRQVWGDDVTVDGLDREPAAFGPISIPVFAAIVQMNTLGKWHSGKASAITILTDIALMHPETSPQIKSNLRAALPPLNSNGGISAPKDEMWGNIAIALAKLQDKASHKQVLAMIRQGVTDPAVITRDRYERFYTGKQKVAQPERFDIFKKYETHQAFEAMMAKMLNNPAPQAPEHKQDFVSQAKKADARKKVATGKVGRNDLCPCGSGKKYKHCCGK